MPEVDWYEIKFLESASNLKGIVKRSVGRRPSTTIANEIAICIKQGRLFFEAALSSPLEIRPLQIFYGAIAFANAVSIARNLEKLETFVPAHGLKDTSSLNAHIDQLSLKIGERGSFQRFNDVTAPLGRIYYRDSSMPTWKPKPFSQSNEVADTELTFKDIMSRIPYLQNLYTKTFSESANSLFININKSSPSKNYIDLRIDEPELFSDRESLIGMVKKLRTKYEFLDNWCLSQASVSWGKSAFAFENIIKGSFDEFSADFFVEDKKQIRFDLRNRLKKDIWVRRNNFIDILPPVAGGLTKTHSYVIQPVNNAHLSEFSLQYLGCFLLSSLVRYKPQIWQKAISTSISGQDVGDDKCVALIEFFLDIVLRDFPKMVVHSIDYR